MRPSETGSASPQVWWARTSRDRFRTGFVVFAATVLLFAPAGLADSTGQSDRVLVIHAGIYHILFDEDPSQEIPDRFTQILSAGKPRDHRELPGLPQKNGESVGIPQCVRGTLQCASASRRDVDDTQPKGPMDAFCSFYTQSERETDQASRAAAG